MSQFNRLSSWHDKIPKFWVKVEPPASSHIQGRNVEGSWGRNKTDRCSEEFERCPLKHNYLQHLLVLKAKWPKAKRSFSGLLRHSRPVEHQTHNELGDPDISEILAQSYHEAQGLHYWLDHEDGCLLMNFSHNTYLVSVRKNWLSCCSESDVACGLNSCASLHDAKGCIPDKMSLSEENGLESFRGDKHWQSNSVD